MGAMKEKVRRYHTESPETLNSREISRKMLTRTSVLVGILVARALVCALAIFHFLHHQTHLV
jgi:hypothetical protein